MTARGDGFFPFLTAAEIYNQLTGGPGTPDLQYEQMTTDREKLAESDRADLIRSLANTITSGWQGTASAGAYGAAMPLAERAFENAAKLDNAQDLLSRQIDSFHTAKNSVVPVGDPPEMSIDEKFPFDVDHEKAVTEYQDSVQNNIAAFRAYDGASHYNETNLPQEYSNDIRAGGDVSVKGPTDTIEAGGPGPRFGGPRNDGPGDVGGPESSGDSSFPGGPGSGGDLAGPGSSSGPGGAQTSPSEFRPVVPPSRQGLPFSYPPAGAPSPVSGGFGDGVPVGGYPGGGFGPLGGGSSGGGVTGRGPAGEGPVGGPGGGARGPAFGPGAGVGALAAEEAAARRAAQAAAAAGRPGGVGPVGAPVGTGRGKDDEDAEHQRKILIEADAEETFGSDELTAPQVIGDDEYEDD